MNRPHFAEQLRALRQRSGKTVREVAEGAGYSFQYVNSLENNDEKANPTLEALERIVASLDGELLISAAPAGATERMAAFVADLTPDKVERVAQFAELAARASVDLLDGVIVGLLARTPPRA